MPHNGKDIIFIHIPKNAGTSIEEALNLTEMRSSVEFPSPQHLIPSEVKKKVDFWDRAFKFTVVRDPYTRAESEFMWRLVRQTGLTNKESSFATAITTLAKTIVDNKIDIKKFCLQFKETWAEFTDDVLLTIISNSKKQERNILLMNLIKDQITIFAPLQSNMEWKKFGYKYFDPVDRAFFAILFKTNYLSMDVNKTVETFTHIYT